MGEFLGANAFLLAIVAIGAGLFLALGRMVGTLGLSPESKIYAWFTVILATLVGTYYAVKWLHGLVERHLMGSHRR